MILVSDIIVSDIPLVHVNQCQAVNDEPVHLQYTIIFMWVPQNINRSGAICTQGDTHDGVLYANAFTLKLHGNVRWRPGFLFISMWLDF